MSEEPETEVERSARRLAWARKQAEAAPTFTPETRDRLSVLLQPILVKPLRKSGRRSD